MFKARDSLHNVKVSNKVAHVDIIAAWDFLKSFEKLLMKVNIKLNKFLMWMRQDSTWRVCQTEVTSVRRKVDARL